MTATNPTPPVLCHFGAPMGRHDAPIDPSARLYLRRVPLDSGGYDAGGAYWGWAEPLYAYGDGENWAYCRAPDRDAARNIVYRGWGAVVFWRG